MDRIIGRTGGLGPSGDVDGSWMITGDGKHIIVLVLTVPILRESVGESELGRSLFHSIENRLERIYGL